MKMRTGRARRKNVANVHTNVINEIPHYSVAVYMKTLPSIVEQSGISVYPIVLDLNFMESCSDQKHWSNNARSWVIPGNRGSNMQTQVVYANSNGALEQAAWYVLQNFRNIYEINAATCRFSALMCGCASSIPKHFVPFGTLALIPPSLSHFTNNSAFRYALSSMQSNKAFILLLGTTNHHARLTSWLIHLFLLAAYISILPLITFLPTFLSRRIILILNVSALASTFVHILSQHKLSHSCLRTIRRRACSVRSRWVTCVYEIETKKYRFIDHKGVNSSYFGAWGDVNNHMT